MKFHKKRRQLFLSESAYLGTRHFFDETAVPSFLESFTDPNYDENDLARNASAYADYFFTDFLLRYTGGEALEQLRGRLEDLIAIYEQSSKYIREHTKDSTFPPLRFIEIDEYERVLQLIGLCYLLHRRDLLPRLATLFYPSSAGKDTLYEDLLAFELDGRYEVDTWYHETPYRDLVNSLYRDLPVESITDITNYLNKWYISLQHAPWHDSHLSIEDDSSGAYFGYWAIEAAAVVFLLELDDSTFCEHLVYPKDLIRFALRLDTATHDSGNNLQDFNNMRVKGGGTCPRAGYWISPATGHSRRFFSIGEEMPSIADSSYGSTIWQWSRER